ncbi:MAG TPA: hypothetical protein VK812_13275 [Candidatus Binatus sp.]|jgi:hypothetical protein|nr:hypothetical protein [Candidatus Binatus sp.]
MPEIAQQFTQHVANLWMLFQLILTAGLVAGLVMIPLSLALNELWRWKIGEKKIGG